MKSKERFYLILCTISGLTAIGLSILHLMNGFTIPGLSPLATALLFVSLWRIYKIRGIFPGGIWTFMYVAIIGLNIVAGISQILNAIR